MYITYEREDWRRLRAGISLPLTEGELNKLRGINENISLDEVEDIYLPLSRLLNLYVTGKQDMYNMTNSFFGSHIPKVPYMIGIAGSVAVGKSTTSRILQALLARWPGHPKVDLVTTDGFLYPNHILEQRGLMKRKGFPESYDIQRLIRFLADIKSGRPEVTAPVYSHLVYDILPDKIQVVHEPDIVIVEGLNILQTKGSGKRSMPRLFVSDFIDFSIYVDAEEKNITEWYIERFHKLCQTAFQDPKSYFHRYANLSPQQADRIARQIWTEINAVNLKKNILPTKVRAQLILEKGRNHSVYQIKCRKL
ncbi:type I pantothenate kinase [Scopulibacillus cellulosilyticus]|uniref:Pantothenate kinase n=1 Tax=Scopulibacillus cellulosilyticus TaxID=2665665 RepID=A0ABW2PRI3_9BACL